MCDFYVTASKTNQVIGFIQSIGAFVSVTTADVDFVGVYSPTVLEQGNLNLLFLGASNTLYWNNTANNIKGFRAYFDIKDGVQAVRARIAQEVQTPTDIRNTDTQEQNSKILENGQLIIKRNGEEYNVLGGKVK